MKKIEVADFPEKFHNGVNISIARLTFALNVYGVDIFSSHASFYPGDDEEQEFWIQKSGLIEDGIGDFDGPVVLLGVIHTLPEVSFECKSVTANKIKSTLTRDWTLVPYNPHFRKIKNGNRGYTLEYHHPKLVEFSNRLNRVIKEIYTDVSDEDDPIWDGLRSEGQVFAEMINSKITNSLPLSQGEFNKIRRKGVEEQSKSIFDAISNFNGSEIKMRTDKFAISQLNESRYFKLEETLRETVEKETYYTVMDRAWVVNNYFNHVNIYI